MGNCDAEIDCEVNRVIDEILREDRLESLGSNPCPDTCETTCEETSEKPGRICAIETSARFSIRILEALKAIQRRKSNDKWPSSSMKEVVQYIRRHYNYDGDLCSQVETALNQVTVEGFVLKIGVNRYHLVGPFASVLNPSARGDCTLNRSNCGSRSSRRRRRRRPGSAAAMSTFIDSDSTTNRHSTIIGMGRHPPHVFQNRNNNYWGASLLREPHQGRPFNAVAELSNMRGINPAALDEQIRRPGGDFDREHEAGDRSFAENQNEFNPVPQHPVRRPGGGRGGRGGRMNPPAWIEPDQRGEVQDQGSDEDVEENQNPIPAYEAIQRPGCCGGPDPLPPAEHSSDENMFRLERSVNVSRRRRGQPQRPGRCRRRDSSRSRDNVNSGRCPRRGSRKKNSTRNSEVDSSDYTNDEDDNGEKPWVRNCQIQQSRESNRRGRRCSPCAFE